MNFLWSFWFFGFFLSSLVSGGVGSKAHTLKKGSFFQEASSLIDNPATRKSWKIPHSPPTYGQVTYLEGYGKVKGVQYAGYLNVVNNSTTDSELFCKSI